MNYRINMEKIPYIINTSYGGYGYSEKAIKEYNRHREETDPDFIPLICKFGQGGLDISRRSDIMIKIIEELGEGASGDFAHLEIAYIAKEFFDYVIVHEYDGKETIEGYDLNKYKLDKIKEVMISDKNELEKLSDIGKLLEFELSDEAYDFGLD